MRKFLFATAFAVLGLVCNAQIIYINDGGNTSSNSAQAFEYQKDITPALKHFETGKVRLLPSLFQQRFALNYNYMMSLSSDKLLQNFYFEAGIKKDNLIMVGGREQNLEDFHWGWESPMNQLRGHFLGHWLSAAAYIYASTGDMSVKAKADHIVSELALCQQKNGGRWCAPIPEKYLDLMVAGESIWSPQYTLHKTLMGLFDMYKAAGNRQALEILDKMADWYVDWTDRLVKAKKENMIYGGETSGMLEIWAEMYQETKDKKYLTLASRYGNPSVFQGLAKGEDALSREHANASIPWSHGAAKMYEATGNDYWKSLTEKFWKCAVHDRESFCTGGQNAGEHWIAPGQIADFTGENNQEHCTVYNMMRTADYLLRFTGKFEFSDYMETNLYNGILAQQHPKTGMIAYFLPMGAGYSKGGEKGWGTPTMDFYCCHGSLVQAQAKYAQIIYYQYDGGILTSQYIPSEGETEVNGRKVKISQNFAAQTWNKDPYMPRFRMIFKVEADGDGEFELKFRVPSWTVEKPTLTINSQNVDCQTKDGFIVVRRNWKNDEIVLEFKDRLYTKQLPGSDKYAVMDGPIVLAAKSDRQVVVKGKKDKPETFLSREIDQQYRLVRWTQSHYRTIGQDEPQVFVPLYEIGDEKYCIYLDFK
ncbi:MAG: glycoside hydrolase family 127 protein [Bacteroidales bacterium]|nr:glycoside hydrolase family 127 protein [Bacteroidales bacterium]